MDLATLLAARLEADGLTAAAPDGAPTESELLATLALDPSAPPSAAWIAAAVRVIAEHQRAGRAERVWPLLRVLEPLLSGLAERDPVSAGRVHGALAAQALLETAPEAFLDRAARAAESFDRGGASSHAAAERAALGAAHAALGADDDAERTLRAAVAAATLALTSSCARHRLAVVLARRDALAAAHSLAVEAVAGFERHGDPRLEGAARASLAAILAALGHGAPAELEARRALDLLAASPPDRALAAAALARALLTRGRPAEALEVVEEAQPHALDLPWLTGGGAPVWIALADAHLAAGHPDAAASSLAEARRRLLAAASKLGSPALRRSYLERIPEHRRALGLPAA